jgi:hypothetical protein
VGRPKQDETKTRGVFSFRLNKSEREKIDASAASIGLSSSEYVRMCALNGRVRVVQDNRKTDPELLRSLLAIGNNLNQIARKINTTERIPANFEDVITLFESFMRDHFSKKEPPP